MTDISKINAEGTQLRKHQLKMLEMLKYVDGLCRKHDIPYYLSGGTLLGAVRHQGFIPWDDDLDIILMKKDFRRLLNVLRHEPSDDYVLQCHQTDPYYVSSYAKLRRKNSFIQEKGGTHESYYRYRGIYIDIFYLEPAQPFFIWLSSHLQNLLMSVAKWSPAVKIKRITVHLIYFLLYRIFFPVFACFSYLWDKESLGYPLGFFFYTQFKREWYADSQKLLFEQELFSCPMNSDAVLRAQYGAYEILPKIDAIEPHIISISFDAEEPPSSATV
ncbi:phosphorylcholine transferase LicD [Tannerella sp.]|uniref:LicD family protein n=1 Tax=Tannerella sp. TaxID=2382127 RepID=UPI0026DB739A|nr:LicD family protein [Tannerella sp.]